MCQALPLPASVLTFQEVALTAREVSVDRPEVQNPGQAHTWGGVKPPGQNVPVGQGADPVAPLVSRNWQ